MLRRCIVQFPWRKHKCGVPCQAPIFIGVGRGASAASVIRRFARPQNLPFDAATGASSGSGAGSSRRSLPRFTSNSRSPSCLPKKRSTNAVSPSTAPSSPSRAAPFKTGRYVATPADRDGAGSLRGVFHARSDRACSYGMSVHFRAARETRRGPRRGLPCWEIVTRKCASPPRPDEEFRLVIGEV